MSPLLLAQAPSPLSTPPIDVEDIVQNAPATPSEALDVVRTQLADLWTGFLVSLPIILIGLIVFVMAVILAIAAARGVRRGVDRAGVDHAVGSLVYRVLRVVLLSIAVLFALSVMGVAVGNVITVFAVLGFAVGLAIQGILENFVAGIILLIRRPFRTGDQIITGDFEGTVEDIDFRVTKMIAYDGTLSLVPNADVYNNPLTNLTTRGKRRTTLSVGVDYRDDHDQARAVIASALAQVEGVLADPECEVLLTELGDSSVNFEMRYWTNPDIRSVRHTQDKVLAAAKSAIEGAGMSIPWPIRTLVVDSDSDIDLKSGAD